MKLFTLIFAFLATCVLAAKTVTVTSTVTKKPANPKTTITKTKHTKSTILVTRTKQTTSTAVVTSTDTTTETDTKTETDTITKTETETDTVTTTTTATASPTFTDFVGPGNLVVYSFGSRYGHVSKYGGWYTSSTPATYQGTSQSPDNSLFTLTTSQGPCSILNSGAFNCTTGNTATTFGQTDDGNMTYVGSDIFGAPAGPTTNAPGTMISDAAGQFVLNIKWVQTDN